jgi:hypothetical protein
MPDPKKKPTEVPKGNTKKQQFNVKYVPVNQGTNTSEGVGNYQGNQKDKERAKVGKFTSTRNSEREVKDTYGLIKKFELLAIAQKNNLNSEPMKIIINVIKLAFAVENNFDKFQNIMGPELEKIKKQYPKYAYLFDYNTEQLNDTVKEAGGIAAEIAKRLIDIKSKENWMESKQNFLREQTEDESLSETSDIPKGLLKAALNMSIEEVTDVIGDIKEGNVRSTYNNFTAFTATAATITKNPTAANFALAVSALGPIYDMGKAGYEYIAPKFTEYFEQKENIILIESLDHDIRELLEANRNKTIPHIPYLDELKLRAKNIDNDINIAPHTPTASESYYTALKKKIFGLTQEEIKHKEAMKLIEENAKNEAMLEANRSLTKEERFFGHKLEKEERDKWKILSKGLTPENKVILAKKFADTTLTKEQKEIMARDMYIDQQKEKTAKSELKYSKRKESKLESMDRNIYFQEGLILAQVIDRKEELNFEDEAKILKYKDDANKQSEVQTLKDSIKKRLKIIGEKREKRLKTLLLIVDPDVTIRQEIKFLNDKLNFRPADFRTYSEIFTNTYTEPIVPKYNPDDPDDVVDVSDVPYQVEEEEEEEAVYKKYSVIDPITITKPDVSPNDLIQVPDIKIPDKPSIIQDTTMSTPSVPKNNFQQAQKVIHKEIQIIDQENYELRNPTAVAAATAAMSSKIQSQIPAKATPQVTQEGLKDNSNKVIIEREAPAQKYHALQVNLYIKEWRYDIADEIKKSDLKNIPQMIDQLISVYGSKWMISKRISNSVEELIELVQLQFVFEHLRSGKALVKISDLVKMNKQMGNPSSADIETENNDNNNVEVPTMYGKPNVPSSNQDPSEIITRPDKELDLINNLPYDSYGKPFVLYQINVRK